MTQPQVEPRMKVGNFGPCGCLCGLEGVLRARPWRDGVRCVKLGCKCPRCRGRRNRQKGDRKAAQARKALHLTGANTRHEEHWRGGLLVEAKAGAQVKPVWTKFRLARDQAEASRAIGDHRPFVFIAAADDAPILLVVEIGDVHEVAAAIVESWGTG